MDTLENVFSQEVIQRLGWTLVHFMWQGIAVAIVLAVVLKMMKKSSANLRYIIACIGLAVMVALPIATLSIVEVDNGIAAQSQIREGTNFDIVMPGPTKIVKMPVAETVIIAGASMEVEIPFSEKFVGVVESSLSTIVGLWMIGVVVLSIWYLGGWCQLQKLRRKSLQLVSQRVQDSMKSIATCLGVNQVIQIAQSALVQTPTVIGWLKPIILLPASALSGLTAEQVEAILAHELAHIKRYDYLVNMLQVVVDILGFYHPAVWWVSRKIRIERENCCDDIAVAVTENKISYAKALVAVEEVRSTMPQLAVAASGGSLLERISRLLGKEQTHKESRGWLGSIIAVLLVMAILIPACLAISGSDSNEPSIAKTQQKVDTTASESKDSVESVFEQVDGQVLRFLGEEFGKTALEAGQQHLSVNSHVYYIDLDGYSYWGGINAYYNWTGRTIAQKVSFGGTSYPNQTHYGVDGQKLNTEIVPHKSRPNHWQIYWIPDEPLLPEESLYYGWSRNDKRKTPQLPGGVYSLVMQNQYGSPVVETFFLVLPKKLKILQSNPPAGSQELLNFNVYWWTKTVKQGKNHLERVQLNVADVNEVEFSQNQQMRVLGMGATVAESDSFLVKNIYLESVHQGKNIVHMTVENKTGQKRFFRVNVYSRSVDFGPQGVGWGRGFYEELAPKETKKLRYAYKIQGPVTDNTYVRLRFCEATSIIHNENKDLKPFDEKRFEGVGLPKPAKTETKKSWTGEEMAEEIMDIFKGIQAGIKKGDYENVWNSFTKDYQQSEYQVRGFERFKLHMEPKHILDAAFSWDKDTFVRLKIKRLEASTDNLNDRGAVLDTKYKEELWKIYFIHDHQSDKWKIDDIVGYIPELIKMQEKDAKTDTGEKFKGRLEKDVSVTIDKSPDNSKLTVQYAVIAVCKAAGVPYNWDKSTELAEPERRTFITTVAMDNVSAKDVLTDILRPVGLTYGLDENGLFILRSNKIAVELSDDLQAFDKWSMDKFKNYFDCSQYENLLGNKLIEMEEKWIRQLSTGKADDYNKAINCLGAIKSKKALPFISTIAFGRKQKGNRPRWMATRALGLIGDESVIPDLIHLMYHYNQNTRIYARISLIRLTGQDLGDNWRKWGAWYKNKVDNKCSFVKIKWTDNEKWANENLQKRTDKETLEQLKGKSGK
ncbi:MAG: M48 family metalloprotease [Anaerohalosphaeraceae bacterium]|nr:M48 family metalloprotease [Anaerohalosphaeraceae bacterium]